MRLSYNFELNLLGIEDFHENSNSRLRFWFNHIRENALNNDGDIFEFKCNNPVHRNANSKGPLYCLRHVNKCSQQNIEITTYNNNSKKSTLIPINNFIKYQSTCN